MDVNMIAFFLLLGNIWLVSDHPARYVGVMVYFSLAFAGIIARAAFGISI